MYRDLHVTPEASWIYVVSSKLAHGEACSKLAHGEEYLIQHYVIKFVSDLEQVGGFVRVLRFPPSIKLTATI
jgi:hypothetical protein